VWLGIWAGALARGDRVLEQRALTSLAKQRFFTPSVMAFARWLLGISRPTRS